MFSYYVYIVMSQVLCRVCVEACLPGDQLLMIDCLLCRHIHEEMADNDKECVVEKKAMHVQSISHWAPANIGPYSQAVQVQCKPAVYCIPGGELCTVCTILFKQRYHFER